MYRAAYSLQASAEVQNGNSSTAAPPVKAASAVYIRQPLDALTKSPAQMRSARAGALPPSMLSRPAGSQSHKGQDQQRNLLQVCPKYHALLSVPSTENWDVVHTAHVLCILAWSPMQACWLYAMCFAEFPLAFFQSEA